MLQYGMIESFYIYHTHMRNKVYFIKRNNNDKNKIQIKIGHSRMKGVSKVFF